MRSRLLLDSAVVWVVSIPYRYYRRRCYRCPEVGSVVWWFLPGIRGVCVRMRMRCRTWNRIRPYYCAWLFFLVVSTVVFLPPHHSSRGIGIKCPVAPVSRMIGIIRSPPAVILVRDGGSCSGRTATLCLAYVCVRVR